LPELADACAFRRHRVCAIASLALGPNRDHLTAERLHEDREGPMPIYGYQCKSCSQEFETLVRSGDKVECPKCGSSKLDQQLSRIAKPASGGVAGEDFACGAAAGMGGCASGACCMGGDCG
jgi:putative FmdB family regulatory protein